MFNKILIANRGEIALRVMHTAKALGIRTVAVFSEADTHAPHVKAADEAIYIGPSPAPESYLAIEKIIAAAQQTDAEAIHPGYGFLSENSDFAAACEQAKIKFIGPAAETIRLMGSKRDAKALMARHGVPVVPGFFGEVSDSALAEEAAKIGFPVLIKASAGGGGRGMRLVREGGEFSAALQSARREAKSAFADDTVLLEKYIEQPRHIEVQIFGDSHGNVVHFFERDCSVQRRYQKLIEEAPAPRLSDSQRRMVHEAAVTAGTAAAYVGAGTVEFVVDDAGNIYFIEMNTRLQVEHPVTEMVTGQDLVALQIVVADGGLVPPQADISAQGHAFELRLCAEDTTRDFAPSTGTVTHFVVPESEVRVDHGLAPGFDISPYYDSMIAKLIVHAHNRDDAIRQAIRALDQTEVAGVTTNQLFLRNILQHQDFVAADIDTHFIEKHQAELLNESCPPDDRALAAAILFLIEARTDAYPANPAEPDSPWSDGDGFRLNLRHREVFDLRAGENEYPIAAECADRGYLLELPAGNTLCEVAQFAAPQITFRLSNERVECHVIADGDELTVFCGGSVHKLKNHNRLHETEDSDGASGGLLAPMPGTVLDVFVEVGQPVVAGAPLMLLEAMKIEHTITAPFDGVVAELRFKPGDQIAAEGVPLAVMEPSS